MKTSQASQLPTYEVGDTYLTAVGDEPRKRRVAEVSCPRRDCGRTFIVVIKDWWNSEGRASAACPYCFKAAWRPPKPTPKG